MKGETLDPATYRTIREDIDYHIDVARKAGVTSLADALEGARLSIDSATAALEAAIDDGEVRVL